MPSSAPDSPRVSSGRFAFDRLKRSPVLRACAAVAFVEYGALLILAVFGANLRPALKQHGLNFSLSGWLALCSLGSWFFLFAWFPFLQNLQSKESGDGSALVMGRVLETFAIACVAVVHAMIAAILVVAL